MSIVYCAGKYCYEYLANNRTPEIVLNRMSRREKAQERLSVFLHLIFGVVAAVIAWNRNKKEDIVLRSLITILAFFFGALYLLYISASLLVHNDETRQKYLDLLASDAMVVSCGR